MKKNSVKDTKGPTMQKATLISSRPAGQNANHQDAHNPSAALTETSSDNSKESNNATRRSKSDKEYADMYNLSLDDVKDIRNLFNSIDSDGGGEIDASELRGLLQSLGRKISQAQADKMIKEVDSDGGGTVDFEEFLKLIAKELKEGKNKDPVAEARRTFEMFDKDKSGSIDLKELKDALRAMGQNISDEELEQMMADADDDGTGEIDFVEFCSLIGLKLPDSFLSDPATSKNIKPSQQKGKQIKTSKTELTKVDPHQTFTKEELKNMREIFDLFDDDKSGSITIDELGKMMDGLGRKLSESQLKSMIASVDEDGTGAIEFEEFLIIMAKDAMDRDPFAEAMRTFQTFDKDGSGTISAQELGEALRASGQDLSDEDAIKLLATVDADGSGEIEFNEFCQLMGLDMKKAKAGHIAELKKQAPTVKPSSEVRLTEKQKKMLEKEEEKRKRKEEEDSLKKQSRDEWVTLIGRPEDTNNFQEISSLEASFKYQYPLHKAAAVGYLDEVKCWCTGSNGRKLEPDETDSMGWTPIMWAAHNGHKEVVTYLMDFGASLAITDLDRRHVLHLAVIAGHYDIVCALLLGGASPSHKDRFGDSALHWAARHGHYHVVVALLGAGADPNQTGGMSETPLHWAAKRAHAEICRLLLEKGAKVTVLDDAGMTPVHWAKATELKELMEPPTPAEPDTKPKKSGRSKAGDGSKDPRGPGHAERFSQGLTALKSTRIRAAAAAKGTRVGLRKKPAAGGPEVAVVGAGGDGEEDELAGLLLQQGSAEDDDRGEEAMLEPATTLSPVSDEEAGASGVAGKDTDAIAGEDEGQGAEEGAAEVTVGEKGQDADEEESTLISP